MSEPASGLQFDRAEFEGGTASAASCATCQQPLTDAYYEVGGAVTCDGCKRRIEAEWNQPSDFGARVGRLARASAFGLGAAVVSGAALAVVLTLLKGTIWGFFSIIVGLVIGTAVRAGCRYRGGWLYQALAMILTYITINAATFAMVLQAGDGNEALEGRTGGEWWFMMVFFGLVVILAAPFFAFAEGVGGGLLSLLIVGFGLYEAWKLNKKQTLQITGPYSLAARTEPPPAPISA